MSFLAGARKDWTAFRKHAVGAVGTVESGLTGSPSICRRSKKPLEIPLTH
jgi:hypothetical protein